MRSLLILVALTSSARADVVTGVVRGADLAGVQVDLYEAGDRIRSTTIGEDGRYAFDVPAGTYDVVAFSDTQASEIRSVAIAGDVELEPLALAANAAFLVRGAAPIIEPAPSRARWRTINELGHTPTSRDRTHRAWIAPASPADPARAVTAVDGGRRFSAAPGIPTVFLGEVTTDTFHIGIANGAGSGGSTRVELGRAGNDPAGTARLVLGPDRAGIEAIVKQPLARDRAFMTAGLATDHTGDATGLARIRYVRSEHAAELAAIASAEDVWAHAGWSRSRDGLLVTAALTGERLEPASSSIAARATMPPSPEVTTRVGPSLTARRVGAEHALTAALSAGVGRRGDVEHTDVTWAAGDEWRISSAWRFDAGVRGEYRRYGDTGVRVTSPRLVLVHDRAGEKLRTLFIGFQRVPRLDDGLPGAWLAEPVLFHDELVGGAAFMLGDSAMTGFAGRVRRTGDDVALGGDAWLRIRGHRTWVDAMASSLQRTATVTALNTFHRTSRNALRAGLTARTAPTSTDAGAALAWMRFRGERTFDLQLEGFAGTSGPGARFLAGATW